MKRRLDNFLCCLHLETGGYFYGWYGIFRSALIIALCILMTVGVSQSVISDEDLQKMGFANSQNVDNDKMRSIRSGGLRFSSTT